MAALVTVYSFNLHGLPCCLFPHLSQRSLFLRPLQFQLHFVRIQPFSRLEVPFPVLLLALSPRTDRSRFRWVFHTSSQACSGLNQAGFSCSFLSLSAISLFGLFFSPKMEMICSSATPYSFPANGIRTQKSVGHRCENLKSNFFTMFTKAQYWNLPWKTPWF